MLEKNFEFCRALLLEVKSVAASSQSHPIRPNELFQIEPFERNKKILTTYLQDK